MKKKTSRRTSKANTAKKFLVEIEYINKSAQWKIKRKTVKSSSEKKAIAIVENPLKKEAYKILKRRAFRIYNPKK